MLNPYNKKNRFVNKNDIQNILKKYGIFQNITNLSIYQTAFTHESYTTKYIKNIIEREDVKLISQPDGCVPLQKTSYETLEYLGDAVIQLVISSYLKRRYPAEDEHFLSKLRVCFVNRLMLSHLSKVIGLNKYLLISSTLEDIEDGRHRISFLEDIFEAFIGAIYEDFNSVSINFLGFNNLGVGYQIAEKFLINLIEDINTEIDITEHIIDDGNYKNKIIKYFNKMFKTKLEFKILDVDRIGQNVSACVIRCDNGKVIGEGVGVDNKHAIQQASLNSLNNLGLINK